MAIEMQNRRDLPRENMTAVLENSIMAETFTEEGDIPVDEVNGLGDLEPVDGLGTGVISSSGNNGLPVVLPNSPTFQVPANPLLPPEYSEILDYTSLQYLNGLYRTQIGKFVRVQQLIGSDQQQDFEGFLIGVGINYIILQDYTSGNIRILDIYSIKSMYVYYAEITNPFAGSDVQEL